MNTHLQKHLFSFSFPLSFSLKFLPTLTCTFSGCSTGLPWYSFPFLHIHVHYFNWIWRSLKSQRKRLPFFYRCCRFAVFLLHYSRLPDSLLVSHSDSIGDVRRGDLGGQRDRHPSYKHIHIPFSAVTLIKQEASSFTREDGHDQGSNQDSLI